MCATLGFCSFVPTSLQESNNGALPVLGQAEDKRRTHLVCGFPFMLPAASVSRVYYFSINLELNYHLAHEVERPTSAVPCV